MLTTPVIAQRFCSLHSEKYKAELTTQEAFFASLKTLSNDYVPKDLVSRFSRAYKNLWLPEKERREQEFYLLEASRVLGNSMHIFDQIHNWSKITDEKKKPSPDAQQALYLAWNRDCEPGKAVNGRDVLSADIMGLRQEIKVLQKRIQEAAEKPKSVPERVITLPKTKSLAGGFVSLATIWGLSIQAGLITVSGPLVIFGVPLLVCTFLLLLTAADAYLSERYSFKTDCLRDLDTKVIGPLFKSLNNMLSAIYSNTEQIKQDLVTGNKVLTCVAENTQNIQRDLVAGSQVLTAVHEDTKAIKKVGGQLLATIYSNTEQIKQDLVTGNKVLTCVAENTQNIQRDLVAGSQVLTAVHEDTKAIKKVGGQLLATIYSNTEQIKQDLVTGNKVLTCVAENTQNIQRDLVAGSQVLTAVHEDTKAIKKVGGQLLATIEEVKEKIDNTPHIINNNFNYFTLDASAIHLILSSEKNEDIENPILQLFKNQAQLQIANSFVPRQRTISQLSGASSNSNSSISRSSSPDTDYGDTQDTVLSESLSSATTMKGNGKTPGMIVISEDDFAEYQRLKAKNLAIE